MRGRNNNLGAALFLAPYGLLFVTFILLPVFYGFYISLHKWHILSAQPQFVGMGNYKTILGDELFRTAFWRTAYFVIMVVPLGNALSLLFALGLTQNLRGTTIYKVALYIPVVLSVSVVAILWRWLYSTEFGLLNHYLGMKVHWLNSPALAMPAIALLSIWWGAGGNMLVYLAGLKAIPRELLEAAQIDGAGPIQRFCSITWSLLKPTTLFFLVMCVFGASQVFGQTYILTGGGPYYSTLTVILYMYQQGFGLYQLGYACAVAYVLFVAVLIFTVIQFKLLEVKR